MAEWWQRGLNALWNVGKDAGAGAAAGSVIPGVGNLAGAIGGGLYGLYDAFNQDQQTEAAQAAQQAQPQGLASPAVQQAQQRQEGAYAGLAAQANPYGGSAWQGQYNQAAQGLNDQYVHQQAQGLARYGQTGAQGGQHSSNALALAHGLGLSQLQNQAQQHYQDMGAQWQQAHDTQLAGLGQGLYANAVGLDNQAYQRGQDAIAHEDRVNANYGQGLMGGLSALGTVASSPLGGKLYDDAKGFFGQQQPQGLAADVPTTYGNAPMKIQPQRDASPYGMKQPKRTMGGF